MTPKIQYTYRYVAHIMVEAATPLKVGSGLTNLVSDSPVLRDVNGLPYVPGTALAGVLRHSVTEGATAEQKAQIDSIFGFQKGDDGHGSRLICSEAAMVGQDGHTVLEGLRPEVEQNAFYLAFREALPVRQHVRINHKGAAEQGGKYDEEVVFKGTRFAFEVELLGVTAEEVGYFHKELLPKMYSAGFRVGGGSRKGFGELKIVAVEERTFDLSNTDDLNAYLKKSASLNTPIGSIEGQVKSQQGIKADYSGWTRYRLTLKPKDFLLFSSGFQDDEVDMKPVRERVVVYGEGGANFSEEYVLIPASSVKGALLHRVAYHYNRLTGNYADAASEGMLEVSNPAVQLLFGVTANQQQEAVRGKVIFSDLLQETHAAEKTFNHVAIDRFTGGAIEGTLFSEKALFFPKDQVENTFRLTLLVEKDALKDALVKQSWEATLSDLCEGYLALGGGTNRGHGLFEGNYQILE
jgi:CRISPR/Cas system CMR subunit Cmr4 (Cas7 group RAMP superfamily)